jgi:O-antigen/teichoic acid export membrane protein
MSHLYDLLPDPSYQTGIWVVLMISFAKLFSMIFGCGTAIITNAPFYKISLFFSIAMAFSVILLNYLWIPLFGIQGAAWATLVVVVFFTIVKIGYLFYQLKITPFSINMLKVALLILFMTGVGLSIDIEGHPLMLIFLKSLMVGVVYGVAVYVLRLSDSLARLGNRLIR